MCVLNGPNPFLSKTCRNCNNLKHFGTPFGSEKALYKNLILLLFCYMSLIYLYSGVNIVPPPLYRLTCTGNMFLLFNKRSLINGHKRVET